MIAALDVQDFHTPNGAPMRLATRLDTLDAALSHGILEEDEYGLAGRRFTGWALDIGGYIGAVGISLAIDSPDLRVVIVEPVAQNCELVRASIALNGLADRVTLVEGAANRAAIVEITHDYRSVEGEPLPYVLDNRHVGNIYAPGPGVVATTTRVAGTSLAELLHRFGIDRVAIAKLDCEGCEWDFLSDPATDRIDELVGEWHGNPGLAGLRELLPNHTVSQTGGNPTNGIFRATHA